MALDKHVGVAQRDDRVQAALATKGEMMTKAAPVLGEGAAMGLNGQGWHCLVTLSDGTTSLYTSAAFGIIGGGGHESVRAASATLLALTRDHLALFSPATDTELPPAELVTIRALTIAGQRTVTAPEDDLGNSRHPASPIFHAAHNVIGQLRMATGPESSSS